VATTLPSQTVRVRPLVSRLTSRYWLSAHCLALPPLITLYVFSAGSGRWGYILLLHLLLLAVGSVLTWCLARAKVDLTPDGIDETDLFTKPAFTRRAEMASILLVPVADGNSTAAYDHLFVIDERGRTRLRMRGQFWGPEALSSVVAAYNVPVIRADGVKTMAELRSEYSPYIFWRERHPYLLAVCVAVAIVVLIGPILWMAQTLL